MNGESRWWPVHTPPRGDLHILSAPTRQANARRAQIESFFALLSFPAPPFFGKEEKKFLFAFCSAEGVLVPPGMCLLPLEKQKALSRASSEASKRFNYTN